MREYVSNSQILRTMVDEMLDTDDRGFTDWEIDFLDHMKRWKGDYTEKQQKTIEKIYDKRM